ncbi:MAG: TonB-dependent receptor [Verrucomicrobiota bacterium]|nr:TonB-dependent receptor [Verrucomicrobiota bacterium]
MKLLQLLRRFVPLLALIGLSCPLTAQDNTTAGIAGSVTSSGDTPVANAEVTITYQPTNTEVKVTTQPNGRYSVRGLRPGGPYAITAGATGFRATTVDNLTLALQKETQVDLKLETGDVVNLEPMMVTAGATDMILASSAAGTTTTITSEQLRTLATVERTLNDFLRQNPFITIDRDGANPYFSALGQNNRYNVVKVDGVLADDPFGLESNGQPTRTSPISMSAISEINVDLTPYDVRNSKFTGAAVNAVTQSGSNNFHGSAYFYFRNQNMVGDYRAGVKRPVGKIKEWTYGGDVSGPILKDTLFFYLNYEKVEQTLAAPSRLVEFSAADLNTFYTAIDNLQKAGFPITRAAVGDLQGKPRELIDEKWLGKLEWQINKDHRAWIRYNQTEGEEPIYRNYDSTSRTSLSSNWNTNNRMYSTWAGELNSQWSDVFSTQAQASYSKYDSLWANPSDMPEARIRGLTSIGGTTAGQSGKELVWGTEVFRQVNILKAETKTGKLDGTYLLGDHTLVGGGDYQSTKVYNLFGQYSKGTYTFDSLKDFSDFAAQPGLSYNTLKGNPATVGNLGLKPDGKSWLRDSGSGSGYRYDFPAAGVDTIAAGYTVDTYGAYLSDKFKINPNFTVEVGLRMDLPVVDDDVIYNADFFKTFGVTNTATIDGKEVYQPRVSFIYLTNEKKTKISGGFGLFYGKVPEVWLANSFQNTGTLVASNRNNVVWYDTDPAQTGRDTATNPAPTAEVNYLNPSFEMPSVWRTNLSVKHELPWWGLVASSEFIFTRTNEAIFYVNDNLNIASTMADGREIYGGGAGGRYKFKAYNDVTQMTNTDKGYGYNWAIGLERPIDETGWSAQLYYIYGKANEVSPATSSRAISNWKNRAVLNPNEEINTTANYEIRNRVLFTVSKRITWIDRLATTISLTYDGTSGKPYSWTFANDINNDGQSNNDLLYIPSPVADPLYGGMVGGAYNSKDNAWPAAKASDQDAFFGFINKEGLSVGVQKRNKERDEWVHTFDLNLTQEVGIWKSHKLEVFCNILNVGNLINKDWGSVERSDFPLVRTPVNGYIRDGKYYYQWTGATNPAIKDRESRWSILVGARYSF